MNEAIKLKPCPFCGGEAKIDEQTIPNSFINGFQVGCTTGHYHEGCCGHITSSLYYKNTEQAIRAWNERTDIALFSAKPLPQAILSQVDGHNVWICQNCEHVHEIPAKPCDTCGGSGLVTLRTEERDGGYREPITEPCPDCAKEPKPDTGKLAKLINDAIFACGLAFDTEQPEVLNLKQLASVFKQAADRIEFLQKELEPKH